MESKIRRILEAAIQAPSGDNCQPWQLSLGDLWIDIYNLPERDQSLYNHKQRASFVAHGALLENLTLAAANEGLATATKLFPDEKNPNLVARVFLNESERRPSPLVEAIFERSTNRGPFKGPELTPTQIQCLCACAEGFPGSGVFLSRSQQEKNRLAALASRNDWLVFTNRHLHSFLFEQIRWTQSEADQCRDGLDIETMGLGKLDRLGFQQLSHWRLVNLMNKCGLARIIGFKAAKNCRKSAAVGFVTISGKRPEDYVQGGKVMQRVWLNAAALGLQFQPYAGIAFMMQKERDGDGEGLTPASLKVLKHVNTVMQRDFALDEKTVLLFFRIGPGNPTTSRAIRRRLDQTLSAGVVMSF